MDEYIDGYLCDNPNSSNGTSMNWLVEDKTSGHVTAAFLLLILVVGLPWNMLVIFTAVKEGIHKQPTIMLLLNLVVNDIVMLVVVLPLQITIGVSGEFILGDTDAVRCKLCQIGALRTIFELMSLYAIAFMAFDRFLFIYKPLRYDKILTRCKILLLLVVTWILVVILTLLPFLGFGTVAFFPPFTFCQINLFENSGTLYFAVVFIFSCLPVLAVVVFNVWVACIVQKNLQSIYKVRKSLNTSHMRALHQEELHKAVSKRRHQKELHMIRVFGALLGFNALAWLPTIILSLYLFTMPPSPPAQVFSTTQILFNSQVMFHPIIETWLIKDIKDPMKKLFFPCLEKKGTLSGKTLPCRLYSECKVPCSGVGRGMCGSCVEIINAALIHRASDSWDAATSNTNVDQ